MPRFAETTRADELSVGAQVFGLLSLGLCWWFPFGPLLGAWGTLLGVASMFWGVDRHRPIGMALATGGLTIGILIASEDWSRWFGS